ncbi:MAG: SURF1 family protein [Ardenticatenaceae bacterium]|nr:SURF1 family protein [Ardenticatenaceae bacterium]MCB9444289.1 SURF1 family protein [Ardenticatenaceae bacterium]
MSRILSVGRVLVSRQWLLPTLAVIAGMIFLARLGFWQLDRLDQRREKNAALIAALESAPVDLNETALPDDLNSLKDRDAVARGAFDFAYQGIVKLQIFQGQPGVDLVAPLVLADGETAVLVDRGWVPEVDNYTVYNEPGEQTISGYIALTQTLNRAGASSAADNLEWYRVDIAAIQTQMPYKLLPVYIKQAPGEDNQQPPLRSEREVDLSEGPHLGYAIQWFLFSTILGVMYIALVNKELGKK